ncbi:MAG TPA: hypothetical protein VGN83_03495 [Falsiroseomonas sp.]|jgi:hypothetical protein|nr:hypothetical protein [Falsiroseomonas sp.]
MGFGLGGRRDDGAPTGAQLVGTREAARRRLCVVGGLTLMVAACGSPQLPAGSAPCPRIAILADGADLTRFRGGAARDLTARTLDARIAGFNARCDYAGSDRRALEVRITPRFEAERGPAAEGRSADLPWFVALSDAADTRLFARVAQSTPVTFPPNVQRAEAVGRPVQVVVPLPEGRRAADYVLRLSFQLTPEELALNRQRGPR